MTKTGRVTSNNQFENKFTNKHHRSSVLFFFASTINNHRRRHHNQQLSEAQYHNYRHRQGFLCLFLSIAQLYLISAWVVLVSALRLGRSVSLVINIMPEEYTYSDMRRRVAVQFTNVSIDRVKYAQCDAQITYIYAPWIPSSPVAWYRQIKRDCGNFETRNLLYCSPNIFKHLVMRSEKTIRRPKTRKNLGLFQGCRIIVTAQIYGILMTTRSYHSWEYLPRHCCSHQQMKRPNVKRNWEQEIFPQQLVSYTKNRWISQVRCRLNYPLVLETNSAVSSLNWKKRPWYRNIDVTGWYQLQKVHYPRAYISKCNTIPQDLKRVTSSHTTAMLSAICTPLRMTTGWIVQRIPSFTDFSTSKSSNTVRKFHTH